MLRRLHYLKSNRGFTLLELIVVIVIIGVLIGTLLSGSSGKREKIEEMNAAASDFYSALQTEITNFQMFDGPLTMSLNKQYMSDVTAIDKNHDYGGIKYYPYAGGNYPFDGTFDAGETHADGKPKTATLYVKFYVFANSVRRVNYANDLNTLVTMTGNGNEGAQICMVLEGEMDDRMSYRDGYYYAKISYTAPDMSALSGEPSRYDYRTSSVKVDWTVYSIDAVTTDEKTSKFKSQNILFNGKVCGVHPSMDYETLGTTGTSILDY